ncbi:hypothetical protein I7I50_02967 [Histoplasma capsulatum G186AR]|uniref:Uncharacterized protein n=1 Tax=Ajellomyces capsulatus TaxID=5037 RepID=A0A8H8D5K2_AJECA|nr:hypothetical protein I7I52_00367 [Histoplasma capsulatum]QSS71939.1 hypothetical protein I7I50_02967 [Histoplasma capsulatum G186AR]
MMVPTKKPLPPFRPQPPTTLAAVIPPTTPWNPTIVDRLLQVPRQLVAKDPKIVLLASTSACSVSLERTRAIYRIRLSPKPPRSVKEITLPIP